MLYLCGPLSGQVVTLPLTVPAELMLWYTTRKLDYSDCEGPCIMGFGASAPIVCRVFRASNFVNIPTCSTLESARDGTLQKIGFLGS